MSSQAYSASRSQLDAVDKMNRCESEKKKKKQSFTPNVFYKQTDQLA